MKEATRYNSAQAENVALYMKPPAPRAVSVKCAAVVHAWSGAGDNGKRRIRREENAKPSGAPVQQRRVASKANGHGPVARMQTVIATAFKEDPEWKEF